MNGAANRMIGIIVAQDKSQYLIQLMIIVSLADSEREETPAATAHVTPDCMKPKTKWPKRLGIL